MTDSGWTASPAVRALLDRFLVICAEADQSKPVAIFTEHSDGTRRWHTGILAELLDAVAAAGVAATPTPTIKSGALDGACVHGAAVCEPCAYDRGFADAASPPVAPAAAAETYREGEMTRLTEENVRLRVQIGKMTETEIELRAALSVSAAPSEQMGWSDTLAAIKMWGERPTAEHWFYVLDALKWLQRTPPSLGAPPAQEKP